MGTRSPKSTQSESAPPRVASTETIEAPVLASSYFATDLAPWQPTGDPGFWIKPVYRNDALGQQTMLMKVDPGAFAESHSHEEFEQVFVLEGSFFDAERELRAGDYCCRAIGAQHIAGSRDGAIVLLVYTRP